MDPLYNNNPNPNPAPTPRPTPGNAMPDIAEAPMHSASGPAYNQTPNMGAVPTPVMEDVPTPSMSFDQAFQGPTIQNAFTAGISEPATAPMAPAEPAKEEPFKAAAPVPGSIGSAVSMPAEAPAPAPAPVPKPVVETPSAPDFPDDIEAFLNDTPAATPADMGASVPTSPNHNISFGDQPVSPYSSEDSFEVTNTKKPLFDDKNKLKYILIAAGSFLALVIIAVIVLIAFSRGGNSSSNTSNNTSNNSDNGPVISKTLTCGREYDETDLVGYADAASGSESVTIAFGESDNVLSWDQDIKLSYADVATAKSAEAQIKTDREAEVAAYGLEIDPFTSSYGSSESTLFLIRNATPADYNIDSFSYYGLNLAANSKALQAEYEAAGFTCKAE